MPDKTFRLRPCLGHLLYHHRLLKHQSHSLHKPLLMLPFPSTFISTPAPLSLLDPNSLIFSFSSGASPAHNAGGRVLPFIYLSNIQTKELEKCTVLSPNRMGVTKRHVNSFATEALPYYIFKHLYLFSCTSFAKTFQVTRRVNVILAIDQVASSRAPEPPTLTNVYTCGGVTKRVRKLFCHCPLNLKLFQV